MRLRLAALCLAAAAGCASVPANQVQLLADGQPIVDWPTAVFTRGAWVERSAESAVLLVSPSAGLLFDAAGPHNSFCLILQDGPQYAIYERLGMLDRPLAALVKYRPAGVALERIGDRIRGSIDVFVERSDCDPYDARFEHLPRAFRVCGCIDVPIVPADTLEGGPLAAMMLPSAEAIGGSKVVSSGPAAGLYPLRPGPALEQAAQLLPKLNDVKPPANAGRADR